MRKIDREREKLLQRERTPHALLRGRNGTREREIEREREKERGGERERVREKEKK